MERTMITYRNLDTCLSYKKLAALPRVAVSALLSPERIKRCAISMPEGFTYSYAAAPVDEATLEAMQALADEQQLIEKYKALASGEMMNTGEKRLVLHHLARGQLAGTVMSDGKDLRAFYAGEQKRVAEFAAAVHEGAIVGSTGKPFKAAVQIGIGGSDLGPRASYIALERWAKAEKRQKMEARFISNVDPDDADNVLRGLDLESSLFILVSKSGTTQETLANEALVKAWLRKTGKVDPAKHLVAVTSETSPLAKNPGYLDSFYIDDYIGGRYSATSAVGGVILSIALGPDTFKAVLGGAAEADRLALERDIRRNAALMDAMLGIFERDALGRPSVAVLPYSQALSRFPAHLQQLDMESNGKRVDRQGRPVRLPSGPAILGEPGTNGQHSFYQLLHQGTDIVPLQFIGFRKNQTGFDPEFEGSTARRKLNANLAAQIVAFAAGKDDPDPNKQFPGGRPSALLVGDELDPAALGALLAHYENKVMFQGFAWNLNSFDQEGVQLGKKLTGTVLAQGGPSDPALAAYARLLGAL